MLNITSLAHGKLAIPLRSRASQAEACVAGPIQFLKLMVNLNINILPPYSAGFLQKAVC